ncbi:acyltransferase [Ancylobacter sp. Lp-2]|uniref:acyltransferase family protein n=1 Tax=Ancylobacter sp. Lp-2 TaxID=2881339 RepID=UPI001E32E03A|nr:acyltransferase family protein [Ancylobacter sp. Lp-2]MCB4769963.1 acyltransferase [Ancylobacter sp. Lp-2]
MKYRPEIDGLRALAVTPVILFHAGIGAFSGGFVGVDIFFVISGYLITSILLTEVRRGEFSLLGFYERRARRILPALFFVLLCCLPFAWAWMVPDQLRHFGRSVVAVVFSVSNFLFWREDGGYFAAASELKPLLHTWSLAVEEQYYLVAPLAFVLLWRQGRRVAFWATAALALASLMLAEWGSRFAPVANFYLTPFRAWELLAGALCAFLMLDGPMRRSEPLGLAGLGLILGAVFLFDGGTPFPGLYALVPVGGAVLVILFAQPGTAAARLLSLPPLVGLGVISYSTYLWHQPLFAFARIRSLSAPSEGLLLLLAVAAVGLGALSWRFVERPFRRRAAPGVARRRFAAACAACGVLFVAGGLYASVSKGIPGRVPVPAPGSREAGLLASLADAPLAKPCWLGTGATEIGDFNLLCPIFTPPEPAHRILVIGDSHSAAILPAFHLLGARNAVSWLGAGDCPPVLDAEVRGSTLARGLCEEVNRREYEAVRDGGFDVVVLAARWSHYFNGERPGARGRFSFIPAAAAAPSIHPSAGPDGVFADLLAHTVQRYAGLGVAVVLLDQVPEQPASPDKLMEQVVFLGAGEGVGGAELLETIAGSSQSLAADAVLQGPAERAMARLAGGEVWYVSVDRGFRQGELYLWGDANGSFYFDRNHLSVYGTAFIAEELTRAFQPVLDSR